LNTEGKEESVAKRRSADFFSSCCRAHFSPVLISACTS
jgi:hypothetical protein